MHPIAASTSGLRCLGTHASKEVTNKQADAEARDVSHGFVQATLDITTGWSRARDAATTVLVKRRPATGPAAPRCSDCARAHCFHGQQVPRCAAYDITQTNHTTTEADLLLSFSTQPTTSPQIHRQQNRHPTSTPGWESIKLTYCCSTVHKVHTLFGTTLFETRPPVSV